MNMANTIARIKQKGRHFEIIVDMDKALSFKKGQNASRDFLETDVVFTDSKKGLRASESELMNAFGTNDVGSIAQKIVKSGEVMISQEKRDEEKDKRYKRVVDFLVTNSVDPRSGNPHTPERIKRALEEAHVNVKNVPVENQIRDIVSQISKVIPIKVESRKIKIVVPAIHTGKSYELINQYKEKENWLSNGDLEVVVNLPSGNVMAFYDKLNSITHGSALTEEMSEGEK